MKDSLVTHETETETGPHSVELDEWISCAPFEKALGIEILSAGDGCAELSMPFAYTFANGAAMLHGGAMTALADTAAVFAMKSMLPQGSHFATIHMEVDFLYPVMQGMIRARATVAQDKSQERVWNAEVRLYDDNNKNVMSMNALFKLARKQPGIKKGQDREVLSTGSSGANSH